MFNCPKCGAGNALGVLFCRSCGERLNVDSMPPPTVRQTRSSVDWDAPRIINLAVKLAGWGLLIAAVWVVAGVCMQPSDVRVEKLDDEGRAAAKKKVDAMFLEYKSPHAHEFTSAGLTALVVRTLLLLETFQFFLTATTQDAITTDRPIAPTTNISTFALTQSLSNPLVSVQLASTKSEQKSERS